MVFVVDIGLRWCMADDGLAVRLRRLRESRGYTQADLALQAKLRSGGQAISNVETGKRHFTRETAKRVAQALDTTPEFLLYGIEPIYSTELPPLDTYLRETQHLRDDEIAALSLIVRRLAETPARYETGTYELERPAALDIDIERPEEWPPREGEVES
jgi:transcriptional regulator with XRE-family HTH domain